MAETAGARRAQTLRFMRFAAVGGVGFVVDTGVLLALVYCCGVNPILAKAISFGVAVLVTFELNRRWAFSDRIERFRLARLTSYVAVQGVGFLCNWLVFSLCILALSRSLPGVLLASIAASAAAMIVNFLGADRLVFQAAARRPGTGAGGS